jgi:phosphoribosylamine-glycine ligase
MNGHWPTKRISDLDHRLDDMRIQWDSRKAISIVLASGNYPGSCSGGDMIEALPNEGTDYKIFHARTKTDGAIHYDRWNSALYYCSRR